MYNVHVYIHDTDDYLMLKPVSVAHFHFQDRLTSDLGGWKLDHFLFDVDSSLGEGVWVCSGDGCVRVGWVGDGGGGLGWMMSETDSGDITWCGVIRHLDLLLYDSLGEEDTHTHTHTHHHWKAYAHV